jgi:hypothetical protein
VNRHQRRAAQALASSEHPGELFRKECDGLVQIDVVPLTLLSHHKHAEQMTMLVRNFWSDVSLQNEQFCLACDHKWTQPHRQHRPAGFMFARSWKNDAFIWMVVGVCKTCLQLGPSFLYPHMSQVMVSEIGSGVILDGSHPTHEVVQ